MQALMNNKNIKGYVKEFFLLASSTKKNVFI